MRLLIDLEHVRTEDRKYAERDLQVPRLSRFHREVRGVIEAWLAALENPDTPVDSDMTEMGKLEYDITMLDAATRKMVRSEATGYGVSSRIRHPTVYATVTQVCNTLRVILDQQLFALDCAHGPPQPKNDPLERRNYTSGRSVLWSPAPRGQLPIFDEARHYILAEQRRPSPDLRLTEMYKSLTGYSDYEIRSAEITWLLQLPLRSLHSRRRTFAKRTELEVMSYNIHRLPHGACYDMTYPPNAETVIQNALNPEGTSPSAGITGFIDGNSDEE